MAAMTPLPIDPHLPQIVTRLADTGALVLVAEPGAGKTTRVPPAMLRAGILGGEHPAMVRLPLHGSLPAEEQTLALRPTLVYLHCGTRKGAARLGLDSKVAALGPNELPPLLRELPPYEVEDILCIYKNRFGRGNRK